MEERATGRREGGREEGRDGKRYALTHGTHACFKPRSFDHKVTIDCFQYVQLVLDCVCNYIYVCRSPVPIDSVAIIIT